MLVGRHSADRDPWRGLRWSVRSDNLRLYSDRPFLPEAGKELLRSVQRKLVLSPLYSAEVWHAVFICNSPLRRTVFFLPASAEAGGANYYPWTSNVFLAAAAIEDNRLINRSGKPDVLGRRLDHFITHEITHSLASCEVGFWRHQNLPDWIKEGYAEYVARGSRIRLRAVGSGLPHRGAGDERPELAPYRRYETLVAFFTRDEGGIRRLLALPGSQADMSSSQLPRKISAASLQAWSMPSGGPSRSSECVGVPKGRVARRGKRVTVPEFSVSL